MGTAAEAEGLHTILGPAVNIKRSPLGGRNFEYLSEDPYLTGELGAAYVNGMQRQGTGACVKHFAANNQEPVSYTHLSQSGWKRIKLAAEAMIV